MIDFKSTISNHHKCKWFKHTNYQAEIFLIKQKKQYATICCLQQPLSKHKNVKWSKLKEWRNIH